MLFSGQTRIIFFYQRVRFGFSGQIVKWDVGVLGEVPENCAIIAALFEVA